MAGKGEEAPNIKQPWANHGDSRSVSRALSITGFYYSVWPVAVPGEQWWAEEGKRKREPRHRALLYRYGIMGGGAGPVRERLHWTRTMRGDRKGSSFRHHSTRQLRSSHRPPWWTALSLETFGQLRGCCREKEWPACYSGVWAVQAKF